MADRKRVLSGMRPTGRLHIGHYFGALENWVKLQDEYECFYFVADWHALTTHYAEDTREIPNNTIQIATDWLASGLDPEKCTLFVQSEVPEHAELHLLLSMVTPLSWLERVPTYKEQIEQLKEKDLGTYGFLGYPLLQTADIVMYDGDFVPVGEDQVPHVELSREIVRRFNLLFGDDGVLREPAVLLTATPRLPGLDGRRMAKSYNNAIWLSESDESIRAKTKVMMTDPARKRRTDKGNPDVCPVFAWHKLFSDQKTIAWSDHGCRTAEIGCIECKSAMADGLIKWIEPIRARRQEYEAQPQRVLEILDAGSKRARSVAQKTMERVREAIFGWQEERKRIHSTAPAKKPGAAGD